MKLFLASSSPRRAELLKQLGFSFEVKKIDFNENIPNSILAEDTAAFLSLQKSRQLSDLNKDDIYITSDTVVILKEKVLGKPKDSADAEKMLNSLSDNTHQVVSGVTITTYNQKITFDCLTHVKFSKLKNEDIQSYVSTYNPLDKAGSYGIQEWIGLIGIEEIQGSYYNVMGLPTHLVRKELLKLGFY